MDIREIITSKVIESALSPMMSYIGNKLKSFFEYLKNKLNNDLNNKDIVDPERNILI